LKLGLQPPPDDGEAADLPQTSGYGRFVPPKPHEIARHFPQLEILDVIGQGGMGAVYKARQRGMNRLVALKILPPEAGRDPEFSERFSREAQALGRLNHPNIVAIYDSGHAGGYYYLLMEYVDGVNLRQAIQAKAMTPHEALAIVPQICEALQYAHDNHVVHRDIKPENVLMDRNGRVKIADFGLARMLNQPSDGFTLTATNQVMGTPRYMAPEQLEGSHSVDHRADIFSLGVVFYELLTGELPLGRFAPPSKKVSIDVRLDEVVLRTLEKEPGMRYQQASEIKQDVESISIGGPYAAMPGIRTGIDYRSKTTLLGWPLLHIATGIDPQTRRKRVARGWVALGDVAVGLFAAGGTAYGGIAIGGFSVGFLAVGGFAVGMLVALGGGALSFGVSAGGLAVGSFAIGGCALGLKALGGMAVGRMAIGGRPIELNGGLWELLHPVYIAFGLLGLFHFVALMVVTVTASAARPKQTQNPVRHVHEIPSVASGVVAILAGIFLIVAVLGGIAMLFFYRSTARSTALLQAQNAELAARAAAAQSATAVAKKAPRQSNPILLDSELDITLINPSLVASLIDLPVDKIEQINRIVETYHREYLKLEAESVTREVDPMGWRIARIADLTVAQTQLADRFWTEVDAIATTTEQQASLRGWLRLFPAEMRAGGLVSEFCQPGFLGWRNAVVIKIRTEGRWVEYEIQTQFTHGERTSSPPAYIKRFL
jgi:tRNA A-37 threonylcarbamoyl transferase component Bud32